MRLRIFVEPQEGASYEDQLAMALAAEELGSLGAVSGITEDSAPGSPRDPAYHAEYHNLEESFGGGQRRQVREDVVFWRNRQGHANRREVMHRHGQGAVHVEHPVTHFSQTHAQSLR